MCGCFRLFPEVINGQFAHERAFAADRGAVAIPGKPLTLARALTQPDEAPPSTPQTDLRRPHSGTQSLCLASTSRGPRAADASQRGYERVRLGNTQTRSDRAPVVDRWHWAGRRSATASTHPPVDERVRRPVRHADDRRQTRERRIRSRVSSAIVGAASVPTGVLATYGLRWVGPVLVRTVSVPGLAVGALLVVLGAILATIDTA